MSVVCRGVRGFLAVCGLAAVVALGGCQVSLGQMSDGAPKPEPDIDIGLGGESLTVEELRAAVLAFSARFYGTVGPAFNKLAKDAKDASERLYASRARFYMMASANDIATGESPAAALLDMLVFTRISRMTWQTNGLATWGEGARPVIRALTVMEKEIRSLAARVLTPEQLRELDEVIDDWWARHPEERSAAFVRLTDFGDLGQKTALRQIRSPGGLLGQVQSALGQVDQLRATAERGIHFAKGAQALLAIQIDLIVRELFAEPEMRDLFGLVASVRVLTEKLAGQADEIASLPKALHEETMSLLDDAMARVSAERSAAITQAMEGVARERNAVLTQAFERIAEERESTLDAVFKRLTVVRGEVTGDMRTLVREERAASLEDAFGRIAGERRMVLQDMKTLVAEERGIVLDEARALIQSEREATLEAIGDLTDRSFGKVRGLLLLAALLAAGLLVLAAVLRRLRTRESA